MTVTTTTAATMPAIGNGSTDAFADLSSVADGSLVYVTDALKGSDPLSGSSTGTMAFRINGAWVGV